jgi:hypothetical protein
VTTGDNHLGIAPQSRRTSAGRFCVSTGTARPLPTTSLRRASIRACSPTATAIRRASRSGPATTVRSPQKTVRGTAMK